METQSPIPPQQNKPEEGSVALRFAQAIDLMLDGKRVSRIAWNSKEEYGFLGIDGYMWIHTKGEDHQWGVHKTDIEADDWIEVFKMN